jgi:hypothetical protein
MYNFKILKSILTKDGKKYPVYLHEWGYATLTGDDLAQFENDLEEIRNHFQTKIDSEEFVSDPIFESIETSQGTINIEVGLKIYSATNYADRPAKDTEWHQRMADDPNVKYNPLTPIGE